jgi:aminopeptidase N
LIHLKKACAGLVIGLVLRSALADCVPVGSWVAPDAPERPLPVGRVLFEAAQRSVVLLGEQHDNLEHHRWQLHTLAALHGLRRDLVLGFEMFPRRVQGALDRWVAGELSEREFLAAADWRTVWNMDPALYMPLFHYARMHRIPMVALDVERAEREAVAPRVASPSEGYLQMLREVFANHPSKDLERFVEAQVRHDRVMAQSIASALAAHPGALMVGIMGRGHVIHGYGVPHQLRDLNVRNIATLLPWERGADCASLAPGMADALFGVAAPREPARPRLGVSLEGARIMAVEKGSIAEDAGLQAGDVLLEVAGRPVKVPADVREAVERQAPGTWLPLRLRRGDETLERIAKFPPLSALPERRYELSVRIDPARRSLEGRATIFPLPGKELHLDSPFTVVSKEEKGGALEVRWRGKLKQTAYLPGGWYPRVPDELAAYRVTLEVIGGQAGLVPGELLEEKRGAKRYHARFAFPDPGPALALMTGPWRIEERIHKSASGKSIRLRTYLHPEVEKLSARYLDAAAGHLDDFERRIGAYPYEGFSIVSSPTPTGYGMPTLTYLGIDVLKLPFIPATSLGHEVAHNWWGNAVYVDYERGNWSEGLTTFMADYAFREREGEAAAREMRLAWLRDITAVPPAADEPLTAFRARTHAASQITGYRKSAMLFFMLRETLGAEAFDAGIRAFWRVQRFRVAAWSDLQRAFESASGRDLSAFFEQWLTRRGAPEVRLVEARLDSDTRLQVTLAQDDPPYSLQVPLALDGKSISVALSGRIQQFDLDVAERPREVALDPDLRVLRRLGPEEAPPILRSAMVTPAPGLAVLNEPLRAPAQSLAQRLFDHPLATTGETLVVGLHADVDAWLARAGLSRPAQARGGSAQVWMAERAGAPLALVSVDDARALEELARPLPHHGAQSYLVFEGAKAIERGVWPSRPQTIRLTP